VQNFISYLIFPWTCRYKSVWVYLFIYFIQIFSSGLCAQKNIIHGLDKQSDTFEVITGDKYFDSGGPGGSKLPDQPGNYINCSDPFNESLNCTSVFTLCSNADTVSVNFVAYQIVTGDRLRIYAGRSTSGPILFNSQTQGVSLNGMKLTTGTFIKSSAPDGCVTFEWFCTTIGNSIGWEVDIIVQTKNNPNDSSCIPQCIPNVLISIPLDTCYKEIGLEEILVANAGLCEYDLTLYYPFGTDKLDQDAVNISHLNTNFLYEVKSDGSTCFGYLRVSESLPPIALCNSDTIDCFKWEQNVSKGSDFSTCSGLKFSYRSIRFEALPCDDQFTGIIIREIEIKSKESTICIDTLFLLKPTFDSLVCPSDLRISCDLIPSGIEASHLSPGFLQTLLDKNNDNRPDSDPTGFLSPMWQGFSALDSTTNCGLGISYSDFIIPGCGTTYKIRRQWIFNVSCLASDTVCIQNILVEDNSAPEIPDISSMEFQVAPADCKAPVSLDTFMNFSDCNVVVQRLELVYKDPQDPGKQIVINNFLPVKLSLSPGGYTAKFLFSDPCFNASRLEICIQVIGDEKPVARPVAAAQYFIHPEECWSRVYAKDLDSLSSDVCCSSLHFAIAVEDSVQYYRQYWIDFISNQCSGTDQYTNRKNFYDELIDRWITSFLFKDYLDLNACVNHNLLFRVFEACNLPPLDPGFSCGSHQWFCYLTIPEFRAWTNFQQASTKCLMEYRLDCFAALNSGLFLLDDAFQYPESAKLEDTGSCASAYTAQYLSRITRNYAEIPVRITIVDTVPLVFSPLPDLVVYTDGSKASELSGTDCCPDSLCIGTTLANNTWPGPLTCNCDPLHFIKYYGGPLRDDASYDQSGNYTYPLCQGYNEYTGPKPIYCQYYLFRDTIEAAVIHPDSLFFRPVFNQAPGPRQFNVQSSCHTTGAFLFQDSTAPDHCELGNIVRTWTFVNDCGKVFKASQKLIFKPHSDFEVIFPPDMVMDCSMSENLDSLSVPMPLIKDAETENLEIIYHDSLIQDSSSVCMVLVRKWQVLDRCVYKTQRNLFPDFILNDSMVADASERYCVYRALKDNGDGYIQYNQIIRFIDQNPPQLNIPDTLVSASDNCKTNEFYLYPSINDDCSPSGNIQLEAFLNGPLKFKLTINNGVLIPGGLSVGIYTLVLIGRDPCGNVDSTHAVITIGDGSMPVPFCSNAVVSVGLPESGQMKIYAKDFDAGSSPGCGAGSLRFSFSPNTEDTIKTLTCDSTGLRSYRIWMTNINNLQATCNISVMVNGHQNGCGPSGELLISGSVTTGQQFGIHQVNLKFEPTSFNAITDVNGLYQSPNLPFGQNYILRPSKQDNPVNGVTSLDLLVMEKHILGQVLLADPYLRIAADINQSGTISVSDLIELRRLILGSIAGFGKNENWNFLPAEYMFVDPENPWIYPKILELKNLTSSISNANFIGVKTGDVNYSAALGLNELESRANEFVELQFKTQDIPGGQRLNVYSRSVISSNQVLQMGFRLQHAASSCQYAGGQIKLRAEEFNFHSGVEFKMAWVNPQGKDLNTADPILSIDFFGFAGPVRPQLLASKSFASFLYFNEREFAIKWSEKTTENNATKLFPNPGKEEVNIDFFVDDLSAHSISIQSINGRNVYIKKPTLKLGWNHILLNKSDLGGPGLYYFVKYFGQSVEKLSFIIF